MHWPHSIHCEAYPFLPESAPPFMTSYLKRTKLCGSSIMWAWFRLELPGGVPLNLVAGR